MLCLERCLTKPTSLDEISKKRGFGRKVITPAKVWRCAPLPSTDLHFINDSHEWAESTCPYDICQQRVVHPLAPWLPLLKLPFVDNNASPCVCVRAFLRWCSCVNAICGLSGWTCRLYLSLPEISLTCATESGQWLDMPSGLEGV